ncbi:MAG: aldo/keto reductase [Chitinophagaceae bacterium]|nr:MAG: aldo/keto reductase [Chitinophagaceae bacterium]
MELRQLGQTELKLSAITFGAWAIGGWMWGGSDKQDALKAIKASYDAGVTTIDTAPIYGQGYSEELVGEAIKGLPREKVQILTKCGMRWDDTRGDFAFKSEDNNGKPIDVYKYGGKDSVIAECEASLKRLGTDYIDLYQLHWADKTTPISETMEAFNILLEQGKIRAAGVCNYDKAQMEEAEKTINLASDQVPYSMVERTIEAELLPWCLQNQKSIIAYSPLQRGILTGKIKPGHKFAPGDHRPNTKFYKPGNIEKINHLLETLVPMAQDKGVSLAQLVIRWTIDQPGVAVALVGARDAEQAVQNAEAINCKLNEEEMEYINKHVRAVELEG